MKYDPIFSYTHCNIYLTVRPKALLQEIARERKDAVTELVREAVHYWLKAQGKSDGLLYDTEEMVEVYIRERERMREAVISRKEKLQEQEKEGHNSQ